MLQLANRLLQRATIPMALAATMGFTSRMGPPRVHVAPVTDAALAASGAVLQIDGAHHDGVDALTVTGRMLITVDGRRNFKPMTLVRRRPGHYTVTRQWPVGTPSVLVFAAEQGPNGSHGVAEAIVAIDAKGAIVSTDYPAAGWITNTDIPKRLTDREVVSALSAIPVR